MIKVSVIIPMYNEQRYIARCLDSLKEQTYKDFELILIDDGSKDNTVEIAKQYHKDFDLTILQQKNSGPGKARNRGAKEAKGEILIFVDADMKFDKNYIKEIIQPILEHGEIGTNHGLEYVANLENKIARAYGYMRRDYKKIPPRSSVFRAIRKDIFFREGGFDISQGYCDDNFKKITSLIVPKAIAYHNNPESLYEIFNHSIRVGSSLLKTGKIFLYLKIYIIWVMYFIMLSIFITVYLYHNNILYYLPLYILILIFILIITKTVQRTFKEKYVSNLFYIPLVMIIRGIGYIYGSVKYIIRKKIY